MSAILFQPQSVNQDGHVLDYNLSDPTNVNDVDSFFSPEPMSSIISL